MFLIPKKTNSIPVICTFEFLDELLCTSNFERLIVSRLVVSKHNDILSYEHYDRWSRRMGPGLLFSSYATGHAGWSIFDQVNRRSQFYPSLAFSHWRISPINVTMILPPFEYNVVLRRKLSEDRASSLPYNLQFFLNKTVPRVLLLFWFCHAICPSFVCYRWSLWYCFFVNVPWSSRRFCLFTQH